MSLDTARFVNPLREARGALSGFTGAIATAGNIGNIFSGIQSVFSLARGAFAPLSEAVKAAANSEDLATTFRTLLGDAQFAAQAMKEATEFADATPFDPEPVQQGYKTPLAYALPSKISKA
ncbi:MAG TPA: hypothetical protein VIS99_03645 [Terrimicrobiaceae bacterium]